jgi:hypothetical protein
VREQMQIVIDIVDDDYNRINSYPDGTTFYPITARLYKAVKDGAPLNEVLDKIRDEIEQKIPNVEYDIGNGLAIAISIIDKYRKEQEWTSKTKH